MIVSGLRRELVGAAESVMRAVFSLPRMTVFRPVKKGWLRLMGAEQLGKRLQLHRGIWVFPGRGLELGDDVDLAHGVLITTGGGVVVGDRTLVGYGAKILSTNHAIPDGQGKIFSSGHVPAEVRIGNDVWIGASAIILPGVTIGEGAVVAAGAVVTRDVRPFQIVAGVPASVVRTRE